MSTASMTTPRPTVDRVSLPTVPTGMPANGDLPDWLPDEATLNRLAGEFFAALPGAGSAGLGQPEATQAWVDELGQRGLVPGQGLHRHSPIVAAPGLPGSRSLSLLEAAPHPVLPQLLHGHVRLGSTEAQGTPMGQSLLQRQLRLTAPGPARLHQTPATVEVATPKSMDQPPIFAATLPRIGLAASLACKRIERRKFVEIAEAA